MRNLKAARKAKGLTQIEVADLIGLSQSAYSYWENGKARIDNESLAKLSALFGVSVDYLLGKDDLPDAVRIPVFSRVAAGIPIEAIEDIVDWEEIPRALCSGERQYFALRVSGDSMWPDYLQDDTVIVRRQDTCESGDDCVVYVNSTDATLKQVKLGNHGELTLIPRNQSYPPRTFTAQEVTELPVTIAGVVVEMRRKMKS